MCIEEEEIGFRAVLEYLREPGSHAVSAIAEATGVDAHLVLRWLRQKRLHVELPPGELECRRCGKAVEDGSFCDACRRALSKEVAEQRAAAEEKYRPVQPVLNSGTERMYTRAEKERRDRAT